MLLPYKRVPHIPLMVITVPTINDANYKHNAGYKDILLRVLRFGLYYYVSVLYMLLTITGEISQRLKSYVSW